ncbi:MAG TPA: hypothetical protein VGH70_07170 [Bradyrhizobium sp.]|jgi:hypothetical protein
MSDGAPAPNGSGREYRIRQAKQDSQACKRIFQRDSTGDAA